MIAPKSQKDFKRAQKTTYGTHNSIHPATCLTRGLPANSNSPPLYLIELKTLRDKYTSQEAEAKNQTHEKHRAKKDPEHAHSHKVKEEIAATITVAAGGFALHEKHERKAAKKEDKKLHGKHHQYHLF
ncbi:Abscisic stress-ripening protein 2 [Morella rubra]|uniref:Abscisic stress-ripening protein 2 n=1 Tax=Morella rubra TaxID=262757 RepID=A0A6A1VU21_9ROSI|nr:Abscisic stress-ripening protein 2 [Morella rubra]